MATPKVKTTYALDAETVQALERMARRWGTSKSEALQRAIRAAETAGGDARANGAQAPPPPARRGRRGRACGRRGWPARCFPTERKKPRWRRTCSTAPADDAAPSWTVWWPL